MPDQSKIGLTTLDWLQKSGPERSFFTFQIEYRKSVKLVMFSDFSELKNTWPKRIIFRISEEIFKRIHTGSFFLTCTPYVFCFFWLIKRRRKRCCYQEKFWGRFFSMQTRFIDQKIFFPDAKIIAYCFIAFLCNNLMWLYLYIVWQRLGENIEAKVGNFRNI